MSLGDTLGIWKPILGDVLVHPAVFVQIQNGKHIKEIQDLFVGCEYGEFRVIIDGNVPTDRLLITNGGATIEMMLDGSDPPLSPEEAEAQEMRDIEELRRQIEALHNID